MKNRIATIFFAGTILLGVQTHSIAQSVGKSVDATTKFMIGITGGLSSPSGNFTSTDYGDLSTGFNTKSGFAGPGYNIGVTGTWFIAKNFGISALLSYHQYSFKGLQSMVLGTQDAYDVDSSSFTVKGNNHSVNIMVGPYYTLPITDKLSLDLRLLAGLVDATYAGNDIWLEDSGNLFNFSQDVAHAAAFGFQGGAGLRYNFSKQFGLILNGDYFYSKPDFTINNVNRNNNAGRILTSYNQPIAGINANLTLVCLLHKK